MPASRFREAIELGLSRGRDATAIWQDLVAENGFDGGYQTVKRYVRKLHGKQPLQPLVRQRGDALSLLNATPSALVTEWSQ